MLEKCKGCHEMKIMKSNKPGPKPKFCSTCRNRDNWPAVRQAFYHYDATVPEIVEFLKVENCEVCNVKLENGNKGSRGHQPNSRQIDHCHDTNKIRGVICWNCNVGIGKLGDTIEAVEAALKYLKGKHNAVR